jgi:hypothetical protein
MLHSVDEKELGLANMALVLVMLRTMIKLGATTRENAQAMFEEAARDLLRDQGATSEPHRRAAEFLRWEAAQFI